MTSRSSLIFVAALLLVIEAAFGIARAEPITVNGFISLGGDTNTIVDEDHEFSYDQSTKNVELLQRGCPTEWGGRSRCVVQLEVRGDIASIIRSARRPVAYMTSSSCNIADILFGRVKIELIPRQGYEIGIVFGNDPESKRFADGRILGRIASPERDGTRRVFNVDQVDCGLINKDLTLDTSGTDCSSCTKEPIKLQRLENGFAVILGRGKIVGTIEGRLNH